MQVVLERMKIEQDVAIHHVIQQMRSIRPSIIPNVVIKIFKDNYYGMFSELD